MAYRDFDSDFNSNPPRGWDPDDGDNPLIGTTRLFFRRVFSCIDDPTRATYIWGDPDENYRKGE